MLASGSMETLSRTTPRFVMTAPMIGLSNSVKSLAALRVVVLITFAPTRRMPKFHCHLLMCCRADHALSSQYFFREFSKFSNINSRVLAHHLCSLSHCRSLDSLRHLPLWPRSKHALFINLALTSRNILSQQTIASSCRLIWCCQHKQGNVTSMHRSTVAAVPIHC